MTSEHPRHTLEHWKHLLDRPDGTPFREIEELYTACAADDLPRFKQLFDQWETHGFFIGDLSPVIALAIHRDNVEIVSLFLAKGSRILPIYYQDAIQSRAKNVLELFVQNGWDMNAKPGIPTLPTAMAYAAEDEEMTRWFLDHGADPNLQSGVDMTPLSFAAEKSSLSTIKLLFEYGADVYKREPLHHAMRRESDVVKVIAYLLEKGAPLNEEIYSNHPPSFDAYGPFASGTPMHQAVLWGNLDAIRYLLEQGADITIRDRRGNTPLEAALKGRQPGSREAAALLKAASESVN